MNVPSARRRVRCDRVQGVPGTAARPAAAPPRPPRPPPTADAHEEAVHTFPFWAHGSGDARARSERHITGSTPCSVTLTGSTRSVAKPGFFRRARTRLRTCPDRESRRPRRLRLRPRAGPPSRTKFITPPPAPLRGSPTDPAGPRRRRAAGRSRPSRSPRSWRAARLRTTATPAFVPRREGEPATVARSKSAWLTKRRWLSPGARRVAVNVPSGRVRNAVISTPARSISAQARDAVPAARVRVPRAAATGAPASSTTFRERRAERQRDVELLRLSPGASERAAWTHGTCRASSTADGRSRRGRP